MNFLGISGLEASAPFKREHWPGLDPREYRISQGYDSAAALIVDGKLVAAAAQERFSRKKHTGDFPIDAIQFCLREAGLGIEDVAEIAHGFDYLPFQELYSLDPESSELYQRVFSKEALVGQVRRCFPDFPAEKDSAGRSSSRARRQRRVYVRVERVPGCGERRDGGGAKPHRVPISRWRVQESCARYRPTILSASSIP